MTATSLLIVHPEARVRELLRARLVAMPAFAIVGCVAEVRHGQERARRHDPDIIVVAQSHLEALRGTRPRLAIVVGGGPAPRDVPSCPVVRVSERTGASVERRVEAIVVCLEEQRRHLVVASAKSLGTPGGVARPSLIAIGSSTGGIEALHAILPAFDRSAPPILVVQHMPADFVPALVGRLDKECAVQVRTASDGAVLRRGCVYVAPGDRHLEVGRRRFDLVARIVDGPKRLHHRPSVDVLFESVARKVGRTAIGALLTGLGKDGASGLAEMRGTGAWTVAQDEATSTVWGMPGAAVGIGAACAVLPLPRIGPAIVERVRS